MDSTPLVLIGLFVFGVAQLAIGVVVGRLLAERSFDAARNDPARRSRLRTVSQQNRAAAPPSHEEAAARLFRLVADVRDELGVHREQIEQLARKLTEASEVRPQELARVFLEAVSRALQINQWLRERLELAEERLRVQAEDLRRYSQEARTDPLTGLLNRRSFQSAAAEALARLRQQAKPVALLLIDLDHFKQLNDRLGHPTGDLLLRTLAERLAGLVGGNGLVARVGGEEFAVLFEGLDQPEIETIAARIHSGVKTPVNTPQGVVQCSISGGLAMATSADCFDSLYDRADKALYAAKKAGRDRIVAIHGSQFRLIAPPEVLGPGPEKSTSLQGSQIPPPEMSIQFPDQLSPMTSGKDPRVTPGVAGGLPPQAPHALSGQEAEEVIRELREKLQSLLEGPDPVQEENIFSTEDR
ncbi:MAG: GGDEF domain-containing protein [Thermoguttaceae bacterium]|nr:GGDEF domain-containing protein [Thermoguttaceae bacterium]MDW8077966.1 GGDEF domain-containing protein [Thermoguttaceae bacterium]